VESNQHSQRTSQSLRASIKNLLGETAHRYPGMPLDRETQEAFIDDWCEVAERCGLPRFREGVKRARSYCSFFPKLAEIIPLIPAEEINGAKGGSLADYDCKVCDGTGWERTATERGNTAVKRCECWLRNRQAGALPKDNLRLKMRDLHEFKRAGEEFYTVGDVFTGFAKMILSGECKPTDPSWYPWARQYLKTSSGFIGSENQELSK
jgi:hypothetical protein